MKFAVALSLLAALANAATQKCNPAARYVDIVIDQSNSNKWTDERNLRLDGAKQIMQSLTSKSEASDKFQADSVAVVGFAGNAWQVLDFSDPAGASSSLEPLRSDLRSETNIGAGVQQAVNNFNRISADQVSGHSAIVLFTDGEASHGTPAELQSALDQAKAKGVRISFVRLDSESGNDALALNYLPAAVKNIIDEKMSSTILSTGGTVSIVRNANNLQAFVDQVLKNGLTRNDGQCGGTTIENPGGVLKNDVTSVGLCSSNAQAVYSYKAERDEKLVFGVGLATKNSPVELTVVYENKSTGERKEIKVAGANTSGTVEGHAKAGQEVTLTVNPKGASNDACQYQVGLKATAEEAQPSSTSATPSECPSSAASTETVVQTVVSTVTAPAPSATASACLCSCDTEGAKPLPKFEL